MQLEGNGSQPRTTRLELELTNNVQFTTLSWDCCFLDASNVYSNFKINETSMDDRTFQDVIRHRFESKLANFQRQSILFQVAHGYSQTLQALGQVYGGWSIRG